MAGIRMSKRALATVLAMHSRLNALKMTRREPRLKPRKFCARALNTTGARYAREVAEDRNKPAVGIRRQRIWNFSRGDNRIAVARENPNLFQIGNIN